MSTERSGYESFLLRLWQVGEAEGAGWRASLQDVRTDQRHSFDSVEGLFEFLRARTEGMSDPTAEDADKKG